MQNHEELARELLKLPAGAGQAEIEAAIYERYDIAWEYFQTLIDDLLPYCYPAVSALTRSYYHSFGKRNGGEWVSFSELRVKMDR